VDPAFVLHGHFYQPPRENPWTEVVPREPSAAPFHDWNARITAESYRPNGWARILDEAGRIVSIVNNYEYLSFNVGPTLLSWMEDHAPETYRRIIDADGAAGRAIAQAYGHAILSLCNDRDLRTHIRWGLADFRHRFGREPRGMWLPETAVDERVLAALAEEGVGFTILAPAQIAGVRPLHGHADDCEWQPVDPSNLDTSRAYRWRHPHQAGIGVDLVVYDGEISHDVAFGGFPSQVVVDRIVQRAAGPDRGGEADDGASDTRLVAVACDGETFGHHYPYADRGVAYALAIEARRRGVAVPRLDAWLDEHPPAWEAQVRTSSWSCAHGVGRWLEDCGCHTGGEPGWDQRWRGPLRTALDIVREAASEIFERRGAPVLHDPWGARDAYVEVLLGATSVEEFAAAHVKGGPESDDLTEALTLLESQRHALLMYTSCGWFFNDLAGIETLQVLRYAARCLDLLSELGEATPYEAFLEILGHATSNRPAEGDGRAVWARHVETARVDAGRVTAHIALNQLLSAGTSPGAEPGGDAAEFELGGLRVVPELGERVDRGGVQACAGRVTLTHRRTRRWSTWAYGAVHLGGLEIFGALRPARDEAGVDEAMIDEIIAATRRGDRVTTLLRLVVDRFGPREFDLASALPGSGEELLSATARRLADRFIAAYDQLRADHHATLATLAVAGTTLPPELQGPVELALARRLETELERAAGATDPDAYRVVRAVVREAREEGVQVRSQRAAGALERALLAAVAAATDGAPTDDAVASAVDAAVGMVRLARELDMPVDLGVAQERVYETITSIPEDPHPELRRLGAVLGLAPETRREPSPGR
jgi:hypothetical protein